MALMVLYSYRFLWLKTEKRRKASSCLLFAVPTITAVYLSIFSQFEMQYHGVRTKQALKSTQIYEWGANMQDFYFSFVCFSLIIGVVVFLYFKEDHLANWLVDTGTCFSSACAVPVLVKIDYILSGMSKDKRFSLRPSLKTSGWSGVHWGEVLH